MVLLCKVVIDGVTVRDDSSTEAKVINWEYERTSTNLISELNMTLLDSVNDLVTIIPGKVVEVWTGFVTSTDTKTFSGFVEEVSPDRGRTNLVCKDKMWDLIRRDVNTVYEIAGTQAGVISEIAKDLIETWGGLTASVVATGTLDTETIDEFRCPQTKIWERLRALAIAVDYQIWYDAVNDTVHFEPKGYTNSGVTLTVGSEIIGVPKWDNDTSKMVNDLRVDGAVSLTQTRLPSGTGAGQIGTTSNFDTDAIILEKTPENVELILDSSNPPITSRIGGTKDSTSGNYYYVDRENKRIVSSSSFPSGEYAIVNYSWLAPVPIHEVNDTSIQAYGLWKKQVTLTDITSISDAEVRTAKILSTFGSPFLIGDLMVRSSPSISLNVGDKVLIVDDVSKPNINEELVITKQVIRYPGSWQGLTVGDEAIRLADWQSDVENRLKRIEEQLSLKNQDIIWELRDFINEVTVESRYRIVATRDTSTDTIWGRDKWGESNWDGSYDNPMVNFFIQQHNDDYVEEFIDEDFKSVNTTASWSTTGSVTFTSGQVAESTPVDFNNGLITTVTLTSTEASGAFVYEVTADNTNWETVTSGVPHAFINTGTSLKWRATEDNASTGEITEIKLEDYH